MSLWNTWMQLVNELKVCCSREKTFMWLVVALIGFTTKTDFFGVTSLARGAALLPEYYTCILNFFNASSVDLDKLLLAWIKLIFKHFDGLVKINGRYLIIADGIKIAKEGKKMPGVKWLHQNSDSNSKAEFIMGHSIEAVAILAKGIKSYFAVPLTAKINEGLHINCKDKRTLLDKLSELLIKLNLPGTFYLLADKYYCSGRLMKMLIASNIHIITMMKKNAVGYYPATENKKGRGRPKKYGEGVKLFSLFNTDLDWIKAPMPNNEKIMIEYCVVRLLWKPLGDIAQFVLVKHPKRGNGIPMSTDLTLDPLSLILGYSLRFKIEVLFKQAVHQVGTFMYRFWLKKMVPRKRVAASGDYQIHFSPAEFKKKVLKKMDAYHLFIQLGFIAQGLMQYLSIYKHETIWESFGTWLRTIRDKTLPSEMVVSISLRNSYIEFLMDDSKFTIFKKFLKNRVNVTQLHSATLFDRRAA